jgi:hypothetical protein
MELGENAAHGVADEYDRPARSLPTDQLADHGQLRLDGAATWRVRARPAVT